MSINKNNGNLADIFNFFEEGSDGKSGLLKEPVPRLTSATESSLYKGYLKTENGRIRLSTLGGGQFNVILKKAVAPLYNVENKLVSVRGNQIGDTITEATISLQAKTSTSFKHIKVDNRKELEELAKAVKSFLVTYQQKVTNLLTAKPGYKYINGEITKIPAILAIVEKKINSASLDRSQMLPEKFINYDVEVVEASPKDYLIYKHFPEKKEIAPVLVNIKPSMLESLVIDERRTELASMMEAREMTTGYVPPSDVQLEEVTGPMTLTCHVSPEGGWKTLGPFLEDTNDHLQIAMYDFSAPHLFEKLKSVLNQGTSLKLVYDGKKAAHVGEGNKLNDVPEETMINSFRRIAGGKFEQMQAWKGNEGICNNAYHIKVAVKDKKSFWLSSGNWQSSNQPNEDFDSDPKLTKDYNREWNIVVNNTKLATIFHKFIDWDFERSGEKPEAALLELMELPDFYAEADELEDAELNRLRLFPPKKFVFTSSKPAKLQPVLSPDNYIEHAINVIRSATRTLYFQNQYIKLTDTITPEYEELLGLLRDATNDPRIDCRIILRTPFSTADKMEMFNDLQALNFDMSKIRLMANTHTKGIIADGEMILIGSHNWSSSGVQFNRDASLVIHDQGVAQYYQDVFLHDWERRTARRRREEISIVHPSDLESGFLPDNLVKLDWTEYLE